MDGTQRREEATDIEEEEEDEDEEAADLEGAGAPAAAKAHAVSSMPAVATSPHSSLAEPPGFSPVRGGPSALPVLLNTTHAACTAQRVANASVQSCTRQQQHRCCTVFNADSESSLYIDCAGTGPFTARYIGDRQALTRAVRGVPACRC